MQLAVGLGLLYAIDRFFKLVEEKLADDTKLEIAVWLLERSPLTPSLDNRAIYDHTIWGRIWHV
jgi:hypothetical protein